MIDSHLRFDSDFIAHPLIRGGHLQTLWSLTGTTRPQPNSLLHWVELDQGDKLAMLEDRPETYEQGDACLLLVHGICGSAETNYMLRLAAKFTSLGVRVFRLNLRGCGAGSAASKTITHAGRSDDVLAALTFISRLAPTGSLSAIGISMGGNQVLRAFGTIHEHPNAEVRELSARVHRIAAVSPPVDLKHCSDHLMKWPLRPYGYFFIRQLLKRIPEALVDAPEILAASRKVPRTLREFDDRVTAPMSGFRDAIEYYDWAAAKNYVHKITVPTMVLASDDDPIVPAESLRSLREPGLKHVHLVSTRGGGHVGFLARGQQRFWMDELLQRWFAFKPRRE